MLHDHTNDAHTRQEEIRARKTAERVPSMCGSESEGGGGEQLWEGRVSGFASSFWSYSLRSSYIDAGTCAREQLGYGRVPAGVGGAAFPATRAWDFKSQLKMKKSY